MADFTGHVDIRQETHFDFAKTIPLTRFASPAFDIEAKTTSFVPPRARFWEHRVQLANGCEDAGIRRSIRPRSPANRRLVDLDDLVDVFQAFDTLVRARFIEGAIDISGQRLIEDFVHEGGFTRTGNAANHCHEANRERNIDVLQIMFGRPSNHNRLSIGLPAFVGYRNRSAARQILPGQTMRTLRDSFG